MDFWMNSSLATPLRFDGSRIDCLQSVVGTFANTLCMFILAMFAATGVVPCLSRHMGSSGPDVFAGVPGRAPLRIFVLRLLSFRAEVPRAEQLSQLCLPMQMTQRLRLLCY